MAQSIEKFRESVKRMRSGKGRGGRYSKVARAWAVRYAEPRLSRGASLVSIATQLGISDVTLRSWLPSGPQPTMAALREVVVTRPKPASSVKGLTLTTTHGHVVSGLDLQSMAALLKELG